MSALIESASQAAEAQRRKLHIMVGEIHYDQLSLRTSFDIAEKAAPQGLAHTLFELHPDTRRRKRLYPPDRAGETVDVPGIHDVLEFARGLGHRDLSVLDELDPQSIMGVRNNHVFQILHADRLGFRVLSNDLFVGYGHDVRERRTAGTLRSLANLALVTHHGNGHLSSLMSLLRDSPAYILGIDVGNILVLNRDPGIKGGPDPDLAHAIPLPVDVSAASELGTKSGRIISAVVPGRHIDIDRWVVLSQRRVMAPPFRPTTVRRLTTTNGYRATTGPNLT